MRLLICTLIITAVVAGKHTLLRGHSNDDDEAEQRGLRRRPWWFRMMKMKRMNNMKKMMRPRPMRMKDPRFFDVPASSTRPFAVKLPILTPDVREGYSTPVDLQNALGNMVKLHLNSVISGNSGFGKGGRGPIALPGIPGGPPTMARPAGPVDASRGNAGGTGSGGDDQVGDDTTDFSTNNQEANVDEADVVKADGKHFFAAYGGRLVVWNKTGDLVYSVRMPSFVIVRPPEPFFPGPVPIPRPMPPRPQNYTVYPTIQALMLEGTRLVAIVNGYGPPVRASLGVTNPVFDELYSTRIVIFETSTLESDKPFLAFVSYRDVSGYYQDGRSIDGNGYIVTSTGLNYYYHLDQFINRYDRRFNRLTDFQFVRAAGRATANRIDTFVIKMMDELAQDGKLPRLFQLSAFMTDLTGDDDLDSALLADGVGNNYVEVISFDVMAGDPSNATIFPADNSTDFDEIELSRVGSWLPAFGGDVYSTENTIVFAGRTWNWLGGLGGSQQSTALLAVHIKDDGGLEPAAVGVVNGTIINQFSVDVKDNYMRIATTIDTLWIGRPRFVFDGSNEVETTVLEPDPTSRTQNHLIVLEIPETVEGSNTTGILEEVGSVRLGKPNERFTAVRIFDNIGYAVTFERTDPFYVLNLTDPSNPREVAELNITGFSSYLHPIDANNSLLLAVGQEATEDGVVVGVQITLFDATDPTNPFALQRYVVENSTDQWSSTSAEWDPKAFRYLDLGNNTGRLIIPLTIHGRIRADFFDGFMVYRISTSFIEPHFNITHRSGQDDLSISMCFTCAWLRERSFVVEGNVMTMKGHSIVSTDLDTTERSWTLPLVFAEDGEGCCYW